MKIGTLKLGVPLPTRILVMAGDGPKDTGPGKHLDDHRYVAAQVSKGSERFPWPKVRL